jgi:hypothetical protein
MNFKWTHYPGLRRRIALCGVNKLEDLANHAAARSRG